MIQNQFFYVVEMGEKKYNASFNPQYVIRSMEYEPGKLVVLLDDFHEMLNEKKVQGKNGKIDIQRTKETICSEIFLSELDSARFKALTEIPITVDITTKMEPVMEDAKVETLQEA